MAERNARRFIGRKFSIYTGFVCAVFAAPLTLDEFSRLPRNSGRHEISDGNLITSPTPKSRHSLVVSTLMQALEGAQCERVLTGAGFLLSHNPLTVRQPDVAVLSKQRIAATPDDEYFQGAPELAIEVVSPSDSSEDLEAKVKQYLQAGGRQVWIVYPKTKRVHIFDANAGTCILDETQSIDGGDVLPGFSLKIADLFVQ